MFLAFPQILFALLLVAALGPKLWLLVLAVGITTAPRVARVMRGAALQVVERDFVKAAEAVGEKRRRIIFGELLPNVSSPLLVEIGLRLTYSIGLIAALDFLGFGVQPPTADWGYMINENRLVAHGPALGGGAAGAGDRPADGRHRPRHRRHRPRRDRARPRQRVVSAIAGRRPAVRSAGPVGRGPRPADRADRIAPRTSSTRSAIHIRAGEVLGLVGESGSGKTTVGMALLGYCRPGGEVCGGAVLIDGNDLAKLDVAQVRRLRGGTVSYIPQDPGTSLNPALRIGTQISEALEDTSPGHARGRPRRARSARCSRRSRSRPTTPSCAATSTSSRAASSSGWRSRWRSPAVRR